MPGGHQGNFRRGLEAPMTAALRAGQRHLIFILLGGLHKAMAIPAKAGIYVTPQPQPPRRSGRQPNQSQTSLKSNESQFKTKRPPPATTQPPHPSFQRNSQPTPPPTFRIPTSRRGPTSPTRLSSESRNPRHPPTATPSKVRTATKPVPKITQIKRITVQDQAPPNRHHTTTPTRLSSETRQPIPHSALPIPNSP